MAPIVKDGESPVATATLSTLGNSALKSPNETPTRPQPVALEIPVTINGARTVEGSDKREPFSETTQTVLVFGHGAVVRVATPLAAGQLVFLTNEKTKKEVVSQVVKSKSAGSASGYVELQFTEPAPGFWGLRMPNVPQAAAPTPAPISRPIPGPQTTLPPASPVLPKTVTPVVHPLSPVAPPPLASAQPAAPATPLPQSRPNPAVPNSPLSGAAPPVAPPNLATPGKIPSPNPPAQVPAIPQPPVRDYAKEIDALFTAPLPSSHPAPVTPAPKATPPSSEPSTEELKLQAARLQAQLSSLLFTETPAAKPPAPVIRVTPKADAPQATPEAAKKVLEAVHTEPKPMANTEPQTAQVIRKSVSPSPLAEDEEVRIPAWLAPLSRNSEAGVPGPAPTSPAGDASVLETPAAAEESSQLFAEDSSGRSEAVFGGQLLGEATPEEGGAPSTGSSKKVVFVLAAAAVLIAGGGIWYFRGASTAAPAPQAASLPGPALAAAATDPLVAARATPPVTLAAASPVNASPASAASPTSQPSKSLEPVSVPVASTSVPQPKNSPPTVAKTVPVEPATKPALGAVHLGAPVVTRSKNSPPSGEALPSIDTNVRDTGTDTLANLATTHSGAPAPLLVGGEVTPAQLIKSVPPIYPPIAKTQRISGNVQLDALIDASGNVAEVKVISGPSILHGAALDAVKQWKYKPAVLDGQATTMHLAVTVQFRTH